MVHPGVVWFPSRRFPAWGLACIHRCRLLLALLAPEYCTQSLRGTADTPATHRDAFHG